MHQYGNGWDCRKQSSMATSRTPSDELDGDTGAIQELRISQVDLFQ